MRRGLSPIERVPRAARYAAGAVTLVGALFALWPVRIPPIPPPAGDPPDYAGAAARAVAESLAPEPEIATVCVNTAFLHGRKTRKSFLLLHGLSNCPAQFVELGRQLHARGHNVYIPRLPGHGFKNRLTPEYGGLDLRQLAGWLADSLEIARGLGDEVTVVGLSVNGATAAWAGEERPDIARTVVLAPFLVPAGVPQWVSGPLGTLFSRMPNLFIWWDSSLKQDIPGPPHAYPWFPTRVVGKFMALGARLLARASSRPPACKRFAFAVSDVDSAINIASAWNLADRFAKWEGVEVERLRFAADENVPHDFIDPSQPNEKTSLVYPRLIDLIDPEK